MRMYKYWFWITGVFSIIAIITALIAENVFSLEPCSMCLKQRHPYYFIIIIFILFLLIHRFSRLWYFLMVQLSTIYGLFYASWHVGIEQKILKGPSGCTGGLNFTTSIEKLKEQIMEKSVINCEEIVWSIFGISAATLNTIFFFIIFLINILYINKYYVQKKIYKT